MNSVKSDCSLSRTQQQLLSLLSAAALDREPQAELFDASQVTDWEAISRLAEEQGITALVNDGILRLPKALLPPRGTKIRLALITEQIAEHIQQQTHRQLKLYHKYESLQLSPVLLKGITLAGLYPKPELRLLGDIDIYLPGEDGYDKANEWARSKGAKLHGDSLYEQAYWYTSILVENHKYVTYFGIPRYDKALEEIMTSVREGQGWHYEEVHGTLCRTLPIELNAVYIFHHILHHFSYLGIGLRQIVDWILYMQRHGQTMDLALFTSYVERFDLLRPMQLFALMSIRHLGVDPSIYPFTIPHDDEACRLADAIIADTFIGGNFGFEHFKGKSFSSIWTRRWFMFKRTTTRSWRIADVSPEHIRMIPLIAIMTRIKIFLRQVFH